jgi:UDP-N-acetylglucosamine pyrophosphorylase
MPEADISPADGLPALAALPTADDASTNNTAALLAKTAVLKLNGGLGTSMGLEKAKSLLEVKDGHTFLDLIALQVASLRARYSPAQVRFVLMDSFATSADTRALLEAKHSELIKSDPQGWELLQNKSPKVARESLEPASFASNPELEWCPPGHGDIYPSLLGSGMLDKLLGEGVEYLFVSNSDNLGATLDLALLRHFAERAAGAGGESGSNGLAFLMEVCERTAADKKGGHLAVRKSDGKFVLRESAMCPGEFASSFCFCCSARSLSPSRRLLFLGASAPRTALFFTRQKKHHHHQNNQTDADKPAFEDVTKHRYFNTNNLWVHLPSLKKELEKHGGFLPLPLIKNAKTVDPRDSASAPVYQLETAMGSGECVRIKRFFSFSARGVGAAGEKKTRAPPRD